MSSDSNNQSPNLQQSDTRPEDPATERLKIRLQIITVVMTAVTTAVTTIGGVTLAYIQSRHAADIQTNIKEAKSEVKKTIKDAASETAQNVSAVDKTTQSTNAVVSELKAMVTKDPEDMDAAKISRNRSNATVAEGEASKAN